MNIGMLWFDNSNATEREKLERVVDYYAAKYGRKPNRIFVNPGMAGEEFTMIYGPDNIKVKPSKNVMPNHFWVGVEATA